MRATEAPVPSVRLARSALEAIRREARRAYPHEGCGALLGPAKGDVRETLPLPNREEGAPRTRFVVSPLDYIAVEEAADARGVTLLGFWHSHPDHPARPSPTDRRYAWPGLLTVVIAVEKGEPAEITAWEVPGADRPFRPLELQETGHDVGVRAAAPGPPASTGSPAARAGTLEPGFTVVPPDPDA